MAEKGEIRAFKISVLNNIGICSRKLQQLDVAVRAYTDALELDADNVKALLGRVAAYEAMGSSTEFDLAIKDMKRASELDPKKLKQYRRMFTEKQKQKKVETETFGGMFERGSIYKEGEMPSATTEVRRPRNECVAPSCTTRWRCAGRGIQEANGR